ncbi:MAG: sigma factor-like helix-turn-helix DNA-binding protein [Patescibacteria group bacterium]
MTKTKDTLTFKPKAVVQKLLTALPERAKDILTKRYGLDKSGQVKTLEAIGKEYGITRERVRQIENFALVNVKKAEAYQKNEEAFIELKELINYYGGIVHEREFLKTMAKDKLTQNYIHFLLVLSDAFTKMKENKLFHHRWTVNPDLAQKVENGLDAVCQDLTNQDLISEKDLLSRFLAKLQNVVKDIKSIEEDVAVHWLKLSKNLNKNPLGEWGLTDSPSVRMRGIRDYAYLVLRHHGSPMHFLEVAQRIEELFGREAHPATCHNELIKDKRFVLVGRGLYALSEWGYNPGVVQEVIKNILAGEGPLTKKEIIERVKKERYVKDNTILVNLQNCEDIRQGPDGRYHYINFS